MSTLIAQDRTKPGAMQEEQQQQQEQEEEEEAQQQQQQQQQGGGGGDKEEKHEAEGEVQLPHCAQLPFLPFGPQRHPCPRRRHHPGENCCCAERLSLHVPHGYCSAGDAGAVHAARAQNLRWRLSAPARPSNANAGLKPNNSMPHMGFIEEFFALRKVSSAGDVEASTSEGSSRGSLGSDSHLTIPPSLRVLAEDHLGNCANLDLRPLEPTIGAKPFGLTASKVQSLGGLSKKRDVGEGRPKGPRGVRFRSDECLVAEVPVLVGLEGGTKRLPPRSSSPRRVRAPHQIPVYCADMAQNNLKRLVDNHHEVMSGRAVTECLSFLRKLYVGNKHRPSVAIETH